MSLFYKRNAPDLLRRCDTCHVDDFNGAVYNIVVLIKVKIKACGIATTVPATSDNRSTLLLRYDNMIMCDLEDIDFRIVIEDFLSRVRSIILIKLGIHTHMSRNDDNIRLISDFLNCVLYRNICW